MHPPLVQGVIQKAAGRTPTGAIERRCAGNGSGRVGGIRVPAPRRTVLRRFCAALALPMALLGTLSVHGQTLPEVSIKIATDASVMEGTDVIFRIESDKAAAAGGLEVTVNIQGKGFLKPEQSAMETVLIAQTTKTKNFTVETVNDMADELDGSVTATIEVKESAYEVHDTDGSASVTVTDDDPTCSVLTAESQTEMEKLVENRMPAAAFARGAGSGKNPREILLEVQPAVCAAESNFVGYQYRIGKFDSFPAGFSENRPGWNQLRPCTTTASDISKEVTKPQVCQFVIGNLDYDEYRFEVRTGYQDYESAALQPDYYNKEGDSGEISVLPVTGRPEVPTVLLANPRSGAVELSWKPPADNGGAPIDRYEYYRDESPDAANCEDVKDDTLDDDDWLDAEVNLRPLAPDLRVLVDSLDNDKPYRFCLRAVNEADDISKNAAFVSATPIGVPLAPETLKVAVVDGGVRLRWKCVDTNDYEYRWSSDSGIRAWQSGGSCDGGEIALDATGLANGTEYTFEVRARNASGAGVPIEASAIPGPPPAAPTSLAALQQGNMVTLSWDAPADGGRAIVRYDCQYQCSEPETGLCPSTSRGDDPLSWSACPAPPLQSTSVQVPNLSPGQRYEFAVRACNLDGATCPADLAGGGNGAGEWATTDVVVGAVPAKPRLTPVVTDRTVTITWDEVESLGGNVLHYEYRFGANAAALSSWRVVTGSEARTLKVSGLANQTEYTFEVRAVNAFGTGEAETVLATPVTGGVARITLTATAGIREVVLTWVPATDSAAITDYQYRWGRDASSLNAWRSAGLATSVTVADLATGVDYLFEVRAVGATGVGTTAQQTAQAVEPAASGLPDAPQALKVVAAREGQISLGWEPPPAGAFPVSGYEYRWGASSADGGVNFGEWANLGIVLGVTVPVPGGGVSYTFEVRAVNRSGAGEAATVDGATSSGASAPLELVAVGGDGEVSLGWQAPASDGGSPLRTYAYRYRIAGGRFGAWTETGTEPLVVVTGLANGIAYLFEVRAETAAGSGPAATATATPSLAPEAPSAPRALAAAALPNGAVTLAWQAPSSDGGLAIDRYEVRWRVGDAEFGAWSGDGGTATGRSFDNLALGQSHVFEVRAVNAWGEGEAASATVRPGRLPAAPGALAAAAAEGSVALTWVAPQDDGGSAVEHYEYRFAVGGGAFGDWSDVGTGLAATVSSLDNGVEHAFEVRAVNGLGAGEAARVTATPAARPGLVAVTAFRRDGGALLRWQAPADDGGSAILRYEYRYRPTGGDFAEWAVVGLERETSVGGLSNGVEYTFEVRAVNAAGAGFAATVRATPRAATVPEAPALAVLADVRNVRLTWEVPADNGGSPIRRYEYRWQPAGDDFGQWFSAGLDAGVTVDELINGIEYVFEVRAVNDLGAGEADSASGTPADVPSEPTLALIVGSAEVDLSWGAPTDDGGLEVLRYEYRWGEADASPGAWIDAESDTRATVRDLVNGRAYVFAVRAVNARGAGPEASDTATPTPGVADDALLLSWLGRFGRVASGHVVGAVDARMREAEAGVAVEDPGEVRRRAPPARRPAESRDRRGGRVRHQGGTGGRLATIGWAGFPASLAGWASVPGGSMPSGVLSLSAPGAAGGNWTAWGRFATTTFAGEEPRLGIDGLVVTASGGADYSQGPLLAGVALAHTVGRGDFGLLATEQYPARPGDEVESTLTGVYPYVRFERGVLGIWGLLGRGAGSVTLSGARGERDFDLGSTLGAFGVRGDLASFAGLEFALKSDAFLGRLGTDDDGSGTDISADASRFRLLVEASRAVRTETGALVTAVSEFGFRQDGGAAEKGGGMEFGAGFNYGGRRVDVAARARTLVLHGDSALREWGAVVSAAVKTRPSGRGLSLRLSPGWGVAESNTERLWATGAKPHRHGTGGVDAGPHLAAELGYAADVFGDRALATPYVGLDAERGGEYLRAGLRLDGHASGLEIEFRRKTVATGVSGNALLVKMTLDPWSLR